MTFNKFLFAAIASALCLAGCVKNDIDNVESLSEANEMIAEEATSGIVPGVLRVKMTRDAADEISPVVESGMIPERFEDAIPSIVSIRRLVPSGGQFERRHRESGIDRWYEIDFDESYPVTKASVAASNLLGVEVSEPTHTISTMSVSCPFNDPLAGKQWHYYNDGTNMKSIAGADINVYDAWKNYTTGSNKVIVAVLDGGVGYDHEDLAANMWVNTAEKNGVAGKDDDGNGYVDDIYGWNFNAGSGTIASADHATHVAGTVAAVNNNGIGVCGVAGGDGSGNGSRIMSCQIISSGTNKSASTLAAMSYAADNGALICQNSWGYEKSDYLYQEDKEAINYFNKYAGMDKNGNQTGLMAGGLVVFAAGNDNLPYGSPASYSGCMAVAAIAPDYTRSYYSNYGSWVDISAPGGSYQYLGGEVYSTILNGYGYLQGTSMACPHVSGVAALIVAKLGGPGFTRQDLWNRIVSTATNIDSYNVNYSGDLGAGLINATAALASSSLYPPDPVTDIFGSSFSNTVTLKWAVTADEDDKKAAGYTVYYSVNGLTGLDRSKIPSGVGYASFKTGDLKVGDTLTAKVGRLGFNSKYYFVVDAYDFSQNRSALSKQVTFTTGSNHPPVLTAMNGTTVNIKQYQSASLRFEMYDPDGHLMDYKMTPDTLGCVSSRLEDTLAVKFNGILCPAGTNKAKLRIADEFGLSDSTIITYVIQENQAPVKAKDIDNFVMPSTGTKKSFTIADYIYDPDGETLTYTVDDASSKLVQTSIERGVLSISSLGFGTASVTLTGTDCMGKTASTSFKILIHNSNNPVEIFPNPAINSFYIRTGEDVTASVSISGDSGAVVYESASASISPFNPLAIDSSSWSGGTYLSLIHI